MKIIDLPKSPRPTDSEILIAWHQGKDSLDIAQQYGVHEAAIYNRLSPLLRRNKQAPLANVGDSIRRARACCPVMGNDPASRLAIGRTMASTSETGVTAGETALRSRSNELLYRLQQEQRRRLTAPR
jgi:hypothetical protein